MLLQDRLEIVSPIVDAHHHSWRYVPEEYLWMDDQYDSLRRDFDMNEYLVEAHRLSVSAAIIVQSRQMIEETEVLIGLAKSSDIPHFVVAWFDLLAEDAEAVVAKHAKSTQVVGARHFLSLESDNALFESGRFLERLHVLAAHGLTFDLLVRPDQLTQCAGLVASVPELTFVLDHMGNPPINGDDREWRTGLKALAETPNVYCKLSGVTDNANRSSISDHVFESAIEHAIECFGTDRLMFGSDWPVVTMNASFEKWIHIVTGFFTRTAPEALEGVLGRNAIEAYNLEWEAFDA